MSVYFNSVTKPYYFLVLNNNNVTICKQSLMWKMLNFFYYCQLAVVKIDKFRQICILVIAVCFYNAMKMAIF